MWYMVHLTAGLGTILLWQVIGLHILLEMLSLIVFFYKTLKRYALSLRLDCANA